MKYAVIFKNKQKKAPEDISGFGAPMALSRPLMDILFQNVTLKLFSDQIMSRHPTRSHKSNSHKAGSHGCMLGNEAASPERRHKLWGIKWGEL